MSCKHCRDYCLVQRIDQPAQLDFAIMTVREATADGTLHEETKVQTGRHVHVSFEKLVEQGLGKDPVQLYYLCSFCGEHFTFKVRSKPILSGEWAPARADSRRQRQ